MMRQRQFLTICGGSLVAIIMCVAGGYAAELRVPGSFATIQEAIDATTNGDIVTVANGTYSGAGNRDLDFDGKAITVRSAKGAAKCTINCGGSETEPHRGFIFESGENENSIVDGFTITNGYRTGGPLAGSGGAIYCSGASPTIRNCVITGNIAIGDDTAGGGITCRDQSAAVIENCTITNNQAGEHGGGIRCSESNVIIRNCVISDNVGTRDNSWGGGISIFNCRPEITSCTISNNTAEKDGGGIYSSQGVGPIVTECTMQDNVAGNRGGGAFCNLNTGTTITGCTVQDNVSEWVSGGLCFYNSDPNVIDCVIQENLADFGGGIYANDCTITVRGCEVLQNMATESSGGGMYFEYSNAIVEDTLIQNNTTVDQGGGINYYEYQGPATLQMNRCRIIGNTAEGDGGGLRIASTDLAQFTNTLIAGNDSEDSGGGAYISVSNAEFRNCTLFGNRCEGSGGGIFSTWTNVSLVNTILWGNTAESGGDQLTLYTTYQPSEGTVQSSCLAGGQEAVKVVDNNILNWGVGNIKSDPNFVSPGYWDDNDTPGDTSDDTWIIGEYHLLSGSDCIDAGDPNTIDPNEVDLAGNDRFLGSEIDMGAYENDPVDIAVSKMTVKAGKTREQQADSCNISGTFAAAVESFAAADTLAVRAGTWYETLRITDFQPSGKGMKYTYKGPSGGITLMSLDFIKGIFTASGKELRLTGMTAPAPVALVMGDYYGFASAADQGANDVINSKKSLPVQLLSGYADTLQVTKSKAKEGTENNVASLTIQGTVTSMETVDLTSTGLTVHWGTDSYTIDTQYFTEKGTEKFVAKKKSFAADPTSVNVTMDFLKCTFKIVLKNTELNWQESPVAFGLEFGSFNRQEEISFE
jgi:parallel beta-helix repeat protein/predicted outer membrane repeat protein